MATYMANAQNVERKWYIVDAAGKSLGRVASLVAVLARGKYKPTFTPNVDCGDHVIVINAEKAILTGNKLENKYYRYHTGYIGGLKEIKYRTLMNKNPEKAMMLAVKGMLPHNTLGDSALKRVRIYKGDAHPHAAQNPTVWDK